jgi:hypothetical protein
MLGGVGPRFYVDKIWIIYTINGDPEFIVLYSVCEGLTRMREKEINRTYILDNLIRIIVLVC